MSRIYKLLTILVLAVVMIVLLIATSCEDNHPFDRVYRFWVENKSDKLISFLVSYNYPDTVIPDTYNKTKGVSPGSKTPYDSKEKWEEVFKKLPADTLSIFIFSEDTIAAYGWQTVRINYKILRRYDISLDYLNNNKGIIRYP